MQNPQFFDGSEATALLALRECKAQGRYPVDEATFRKELAQRLKGARGKAVPAKEIAAILKSLIQRRAVASDKARTTKGMKALLTLHEDRELVYQFKPGELQAAVTEARKKLKYPVALTALVTALKLTRGGKEFLTANLEQLAREDSGVSLAWAGTGRTRKPVLVLKSEEDFARKLKATEVLRLRIEHADLLRAPRAESAASPAAGSMPAKKQAAPEASELRERILSVYDELRCQERKRSVPIPRLRQSLSDVDRGAIDRELVALCNAEQFELSVHDHQHLLSEVERSAQLAWPGTGRSYYYLARIE